MSQLDNTGKVGTQVQQAVRTGAGAEARQAAVVGAGIGGLAAGIALSQAGWEATVYESAAELHPLGAGLSIWPNGVRALRALGLGAVTEGAPRTDGALRRADGSLLAEFDPDVIEERYGAPLVGLHRAELHEALADGLGTERLRLGMPLESLEGDELRFANGSTRRADLIVGADGIGSTVRAALIGDGEPRDSGIVAFRGVSPGASGTSEEDAVSGGEGGAPTGEGAAPAGEWWGRGTAAGLLPLRDGRVYWYLAFRGEPEREALPGRVAEFDPAVQKVVARTPEAEVLVHRLYDRDPVKSWSRGNVTLLGDAAHPMLPFLGQGANSGWRTRSRSVRRLPRAPTSPPRSPPTSGPGPSAPRLWSPAPAALPGSPCSAPASAALSATPSSPASPSPHACASSTPSSNRRRARSRDAPLVLCHPQGYKGQREPGFRTPSSTPSAPAPRPCAAVR